MKATFRYPILILGLLLFNSNANLDVRPAMVQFDKAFLPALDYAWQGDSEAAKRAVFQLEFRWRRLRAQLDSYLPEEALALNRIDNWLGDAYYAIDANRYATAANQLEHVKYELMVLRDQHGIAYYLDDMYDFQGGLEVLTEAAADEMLCLMSWGEFAALSRSLQVEWAQIQLKPLDAALYDFDEAKLKQLKYRQQALATALHAFGEAVGHADRTLIEQRAQALMPAFQKVLRLFGDYESTQHYFAQHQ